MWSGDLKLINIIANSSRPLMKSPLLPYNWFFMDMSYFTCMDLSPALSMTFLKALESLASMDWNLTSGALARASKSG